MNRKAEIEHNRAVVRRIRAELSAPKNLPATIWPSSKTVEKVLQEVGKKFVPPGLDRERLRRDLHDFRVKFSIFAAQAKTNQRSRRKVAGKIRSHAEGLHDLLANPPDFTLDFNLWPLTGITREQLLAALREIHEEVGRELPEPTSAKTTWLIKNLVPIYEAHFNRRAGRSKSWDGRKVGGPFVRFVQAVQNEVGLPVSTAASIETYIKLSRRNGDRM